MAKIIYGEELGKIITEITKNPEKYLDDPQDVLSFVTSIAQQVANVAGGEVGNPDFDEEGKVLISMRIDERVPDNGGIWNRYDKDVTWKNGEETQK